MQVSLPPGTPLIAKTGAVTFSLIPLYMNSTLPSLSYGLRLWGIQNMIPFAVSSKQQTSILELNSSTISRNKQQLFDNNNIKNNSKVSMNVNNDNSIAYSVKLPTAVSLQKLTNYFVDMNVILVVIRDPRANKELGVGYIKIKRYIINGLIADFQQKVDIMPTTNYTATTQNNNQFNSFNNSPKVVIGQVLIKLRFQAFERQINNINSHNNEYEENQVHQQTKKHLDYQNSVRHYQKSFEQNGNVRKLIVQPHIFEAHNNNGKQFVIDQKTSKDSLNKKSIRNIYSQQEQQELQYQINDHQQKQKQQLNHNQPQPLGARDLLTSIGRKLPMSNTPNQIPVSNLDNGNSNAYLLNAPSNNFQSENRNTVVNIAGYQNRQMAFRSNKKIKSLQKKTLQFLQADSINEYPDLQSLIARYGRNNVYAEKMRLKLDEAKYLSNHSSTIDSINTRNDNETNEGYLLRVKNIGNNNTWAQELTITLTKSQKQKQIITTTIVKNIPTASTNVITGIYTRTLQNGNILQFENKLYKAKCIIKSINILNGEAVKVYVRRKDNNKKVAQFQVQIVSTTNIHQNNTNNMINNNKQIPISEHDKNKGKMHYYISIQPIFTKREPESIITIHPLCQKQGVKGNKMIFTSQNVTQPIKIKVGASNKSVTVQDNQVMLSIDPNIKMKQSIVALNKIQYRVFTATAENVDSLMKIAVSHDKNTDTQNRQFTQQMIPNNGNKQWLNNKNKQQYGQDRTRSQKLQLLIASFQHLLSSSNQTCMQMVNKLTNPRSIITQEQQVHLFYKLCHHAGIAHPNDTANFAFKQLLHGQFSMFWSCFTQYKNWNNKYNSAVHSCIKNIHKIFMKQGEGEISRQLFKNRQMMYKKIFRLYQKIIRKLQSNKDNLFGLLPVQVAEQTIQSIIKSELTERQHKQLKVVQENQRLHSQKQKENQQIYEDEQAGKAQGIGNKSEYANRIIQQVTKQFNQLITLLCRYVRGDDGISTHCIKLQQLGALLLPRQQEQHNCNIMINKHQLEAIALHSQAHHSPQEQNNNNKVNKNNQLLFQVVQSCSQHRQDSIITGITTCKNLYDVLTGYQKMSMQSSSMSSMMQMDSYQAQNRRITTQSNTNQYNNDNRMHTEQEKQKMYTQQAQANKKHHNIYRHAYTQQSNINISKQIQKQRQNNRNNKNNKNIKLYLTQLCLLSTQQTIVDNSANDTIIEIYKTSKVNTSSENYHKQCIMKVAQSELPVCINLREMEDYQVIVTVYELLKQKVINDVPSVVIYRLEGVFIASQHLQKILLHKTYTDRQQRHQTLNSAYILTKFNYNGAKNGNQDDLIIQIKNELKIPQSEIKRLSIDQQELIEQQNKRREEQVIQITKSKIQDYKILSITPPSRSHEGYQIYLQGEENGLIKYPNENVCGTIKNNKQQQYLNIFIKNQQSDRKNAIVHKDFKFAQRIHKVQGIQQVCLTYDSQIDGTGKVVCIVTIQLAVHHPISEQLISNSNISRWMIINIYHMQSVKKIIEISKQFTLVVTTQSNSQPVFIKDVSFDQNWIHQQFLQLNNTQSYKRQKHMSLRSLWLGLSINIPFSSKYIINVYTRDKPHTKYLQQNLYATFVFSLPSSYGQYMNVLGVAEYKGYLIDLRSGSRMALTMINVNYNDVFSMDKGKGKQTYQSLLSIFKTQNIIKLWQYKSRNGQQFWSHVRSSFGYNSVQMHLLKQLQANDQQQLQLQLKLQNEHAQNIKSYKIFNMIMNWDVDISMINLSQCQDTQQLQIRIRQTSRNSTNSILAILDNSSNYSVADLYSQYQLYDFDNSGTIPSSKLQIVHKLMFNTSQTRNTNTKQQQTRTIANTNTNKKTVQTTYKQKNLKDMNFSRNQQYVDYMLILWSMRQHASVDGFFMQGQTSSQLASIVPDYSHKYDGNNSISRISKKDAISICIASFNSLKVEQQPGSLIFYINGQKLAEPIPRCYTHQYKQNQSKTITTSLPLVLEVYNKKYGVKQLVTEELVASLQVREQKVELLGGYIQFHISSHPNKNIQRLGLETDGNNINRKTNRQNIQGNGMRQSRRQKWSILKQSKLQTEKIQQVLSKIST